MLSLVMKEEGDRRKLYKIVLPSFFIHFVAAILTVVLIFLLTRTLGAANYGVYTFSFSVVFVIVNLATYGINILAVREIPSLRHKGRTDMWKGFYRWSSRTMLGVLMVVTILSIAFMGLFVFYFHLIKETVYSRPVMYAMTAIPFYGFMTYYTSVLRGQDRPVLSLLPDNFLKPMAFLISYLAVYLVSRYMTLQNAILLNALSFGIGLLLTFIMYRKTTRKIDVEPQYDKKKWKLSWRSLFLLTVVVSINSRLDIIMMGALKQSADVGIYALADRIAAALTIFLTVMNLVTAASYSRLHALNEKEKLQALVTKVTRWVVVISIPVYLIIVGFSSYILSFSGPRFMHGQEALIIICTAQLISIALGPVGNLSVMTGHEKYNIIFNFIKLGLLLALNLLLTPAMGVNGGAIATAVCIVFWNAGMFITIKKKTGISTWIFG